MNATPILPGLSAVEGKLLTATFDAGRLSSDGGVIVLREIAERLDLAETITGCVTIAIPAACGTATARWRWRGWS